MLNTKYSVKLELLFVIGQGFDVILGIAIILIDYFIAAKSLLLIDLFGLQ